MFLREAFRPLVQNKWRKKHPGFGKIAGSCTRVWHWF
jgi:hypothetical protein